MSADDWLRYLIPFGTTAIGLSIGWLLKSNESHDSEFSNRIDDIVEELNKIEDLGIDAWKEISISEPACPDVGKINVIEGRLHRLTGLLDDISERVPDYSKYEPLSKLRKLRMACTDDGQGTVDFPLPPGLLRTKTILLQCTDLLRTLRQMRVEVLPQQSIRRWVRRLRLRRLENRERQYWDY